MPEAEAPIFGLEPQAIETAVLPAILSSSFLNVTLPSSSIMFSSKATRQVRV
jgi:hypothetical protein